MRKATVKYIESELYHFEENKKLIQELEMNHIYRRITKEVKDVGGGKSNMIYSKTESSTLKMNDDRLLENLKRNVAAIQDVYERCSDEYKKLIKSRYWSNDNKTWTGIAQDLFVSERKALYMRKNIVEQIGENMGLV